MTREEALRRLQAIGPKLVRYYEVERNYDRDQRKHTSVSMLSPRVRHQIIFEEELVEVALRTHSYQALDKFIQEVFWRTY